MSGAIQLRIGAASLVAEATRAGRTTWRAETGYAGPPDLAEALATLAAELPARVRGWRVHVWLEPPLVQVRTLEGIPPVRSAALRALVGQQADRYFRRTGRPVVLDARWTGPSPRARTRVRAAATDEALASSVVASLHTAGLHVAGVGVAGSAHDVALDLLPSAERAQRARRRRVTTVHLALTAAGLWIVVLATAVSRLYRERDALTRERASIARPLAALRSAQHEVGAGRQMLSAVEATSAAQAAFSVRLAAILRALPDSAFLASVTLDEVGGGSVTGVAPRATQVVAALEADSSIRRASMDGPSVREVVRGKDWERFVIVLGERSPR